MKDPSQSLTVDSDPANSGHRQRHPTIPSLGAAACRMVYGMNAAKSKGDQGEREAVLVLCQMAPDLALPNARRKLGAGRRDDMGDIDVFSDVTVQGKTMADVTSALRQAASGAAVQSVRAGTRWPLGMAPIPRARRCAVRWLAATTEWPGGTPPEDETMLTGRSEAAVSHARNEKAGIPRVRRISLVKRSGSAPMYVAPVEAWVDAYRLAALLPHGAQQDDTR